jgi:iron complex transport system ATP-binding protein
VRERGLATIVVLHDLNLAARYCDRVLVLDRGRVLAEGPPAEALEVGLVGGTYGVAAERATASDGTAQFLFRGAPSRPTPPQEPR